MEQENRLTAFYQRLSPREQKLAVLWVFAMIFIALFIVGVQINSGIEKRRAAIEEYSKALKLIAERQDEYVNAQGGSGSLDERIEKNELKLQTFLDKEATRFDLKINNFKESSVPIGGKRPKKGEAVKGIVEESVTIDIENADYTKFARFADKIRTSPELIVIKRLDVQKARRSADPQEVRITMTVSTFKMGDG